MNRKLLFVLLLLPGLAQAVICKTVGPDGVASFTDVPAAECPQGSRIPDYSRPARVVEQAGSVDTGVSARQVKFAGYESIEIVSPEDDGTVRSNEGRVPVLVALEPGLQQSHFITAYLDGKAFRGRYGSSQIELTAVDRGTHKLYVKVQDSKGKTLIKSDVISFTVQSASSGLAVNPITGDNYVDIHDPGLVKILGCYECGEKRHYDDLNFDPKLQAWVTLWFPVRNVESKLVEVLPETETVERVIKTPEGEKMTVVETYNWVIEVPREYLQTEASFEARVRLIPKVYENVPIEKIPIETIPIQSRITSRHSVDPKLFGRYDDDRWKNRDDVYSRDREYFEGDRDTEYIPSPSTPGESNPAFNPGSMTTPGQTNPAYTP